MMIVAFDVTLMWSMWLRCYRCYWYVIDSIDSIDSLILIRFCLISNDVCPSFIIIFPPLFLVVGRRTIRSCNSSHKKKGRDTTRTHTIFSHVPICVSISRIFFNWRSKQARTWHGICYRVHNIYSSCCIFILEKDAWDQQKDKSYDS